MRVFLVNPSHVSFGTAVITPRWLYVLAGATPAQWGDPIMLRRNARAVRHRRAHARRRRRHRHPYRQCAATATRSGSAARARGAYVVFGGIHATLYPMEPHELGGAHAVVRGDGDSIWGTVIDDCVHGTPQDDLRGRTDCRRPVQAGAVGPAAAQSLHVGLDSDRPRLPQALLVLLGVAHRRPGAAAIGGRRGHRRSGGAATARLPLHRAGRRQLLSGLAGRPRRRRSGATIRPRLRELEAIRAERFALMERLSRLPDDMVFYTQITMEAAEDPPFMQAMNKARIRGALVGIEAVTAEGLKDVYKGFNLHRRGAGRAAAALQGTRHLRARLVHLRPAERSSRHIRSHGGAGRAGRRVVRPVRHADAVSRHGRFREMGTRAVGRTPRPSPAFRSPAIG